MMRKPAARDAAAIQIRKMTYAAMFLAIAMALPLITGAAVRIHVRMALGAGGRPDRAAAPIGSVRNAGDVSDSGSHGV